MGVGFYEQDESTDRILFDAFQMPTADALDSEPQMSDFVKKTLRLAKRRARLEQDDDPDFQGPKSHKKKPRTGNIEQLVNLDPALLGVLGDSTPTPTHEPHPSRPAPGDPTGGIEGQNGGQQGENLTPAPKPRPTRPPLPIDPLRPTLRHAKPMTSYIEAEEPVEDPDDTIPIMMNNEPEPSTVDLAAEAVRAITGTPAPQTELSNTEPTPQYTGKKRGRPPRSSLSTDSSPATETKRRGRPPGRGRARRSTLSRVENLEDTTMVDVDDQADDGSQNNANNIDENVTVDELEAQLAEELGSPEDNDVQPDYTPPQNGLSKRRGRPPGAQRSQPPVVPPTESKRVPEPTRDFRSMSMQERMALKGKKIRIGQRGRTRDTGMSRNSTPTPTVTARKPSRPALNMDAEQPSTTLSVVVLN
ncbi:hypothetical protein RRF57_006941 [Xylaria bambusicola]|uniref:Uncharacterized protein n=1 Tax=Xylaria bambusicola TaxID=326684 RepID=A0AAN7UM08_9PEZI